MKAILPAILPLLLVGCNSIHSEWGPISGLMTCGSPYDLTQDCNWLYGATRDVRIRGVDLRIAGTEAGDTVLVQGSSWISVASIEGLESVIGVLEEAGIAVLRVRAAETDWVFGYVLILDGDGYEVLKTHAAG